MNAIIVDDTQAAIDNLVDKLQKYPDVSVVATAGTGEEGLDMIMRHKPDLLFLDVELPDMTGIEFLSQFNDLAEWPCHVVIYTAYTDYMLPAFRNKAFDFLLKPVDDKELDTVISRFYEERDSEKAAVIKDDSIIKNGNDKLLFYTNTVDFRLVQIRDICVFSYDHDTRVWMAVAAGCDKPMRLKRNVNKDVLLGIDSSFIQVSQKYIININYLMEVCDNICRFYPPFDNIDYVKVAAFIAANLSNVSVRYKSAGHDNGLFYGAYSSYVGCKILDGRSETWPALNIITTGLHSRFVADN